MLKKTSLFYVEHMDLSLIFRLRQKQLQNYQYLEPGPYFLGCAFQMLACPILMASEKGRTSQVLINWVKFTPEKNESGSCRPRIKFGRVNSAWCIWYIDFVSINEPISPNVESGGEKRRVT